MHQMTHRCVEPLAERRRHFWTTQPDACGEYKSCGAPCGLPGLKYEVSQPVEEGRTFATNDWVRSLLLNIFNTVARQPASACGNLPGRQGGHWSESYGDGTYFGTHMFEQTTNTSFRDSMALLKAKVSKDAYKLVTYGVATAVEVAMKYLGSNRVAIEISVTGPRITDGVVNLTVERISNSWVWT